MKAAIYARVSTTNGQSPAMQLDELRDYCRRRGWEVLEEYVDNGHSGARESRPALDRLMADARKRLVDAVVVYRYDRFARSLRQLVNALEEFRALGEHRIRSMGGKAPHLSLWFEGKDLPFSLLCPRSNRLPRRRWARRRLSGSRVGPFCAASQTHVPSSACGRPPAVCRLCGAPIRFGRTYCASCAVTVSKQGLVKAARLGRVAGHSREARARQAEKQRRHAAAKRAWRPSDQPAWLDQQTYLQKIQPRLTGITVPFIASALGLSEPYAAEIRAGRRRPHPRHWQVLARLVGVSPDMQSGPNGPTGQFRHN